MQNIAERSKVQIYISLARSAAMALQIPGEPNCHGSGGSRQHPCRSQHPKVTAEGRLRRTDTRVARVARPSNRVHECTRDRSQHICVNE